MKNVVVIAPHPDDETLGCGGTIAKKVLNGDKVFVVFMTDGRYALTDIGVKSCPDPIRLKEIRIEEALRAARVLGLQEKNIFFLEVEDTLLQRYKRYAKGMLLKILKENPPSEIYYPQKLEYNEDHRAANIIVKEVLNQLDTHPIAGYQYAIAWNFPFSTMLRILGENAFYLSMSMLFNCNLIRSDISKFLLIKRAAIEQYASQLNLLSSDQKRPVLEQSFVRIFLKNEEKFFVYFRGSK
jgi:LmbE family N-acetylglucosaminyl deacetylase